MLFYELVYKLAVAHCRYPKIHFRNIDAVFLEVYFSMLEQVYDDLGSY